jgi:hypothetical protein
MIAIKAESHPSKGGTRWSGWNGKRSARLDDYLTQENIRPILRSALYDLEKCRQELDNQAHKFLQWPWKKEKKRQVVTDFARLLQEFHNYYNDLAAKGLALEDNPSGFNWWVLNELRNYLADDNDPRTPTKVVDALRANPRAKQGHAFLTKTNKHITKLEGAFSK